MFLLDAPCGHWRCCMPVATVSLTETPFKPPRLETPPGEFKRSLCRKGSRMPVAPWRFCGFYFCVYRCPGLLRSCLAAVIGPLLMFLASLLLVLSNILSTRLGYANATFLSSSTIECQMTEWTNYEATLSIFFLLWFLFFIWYWCLIRQPKVDRISTSIFMLLLCRYTPVMC